LILRAKDVRHAEKLFVRTVCAPNAAVNFVTARNSSGFFGGGGGGGGGSTTTTTTTTTTSSSSSSK
jgi:hypothetical protein